MVHQTRLSRSFCATLNKLGIRYVVGGSFASGAFGQQRYTNDLDSVLSLELEDVDRFVAAFQSEYLLSRNEIEDALHSTGPFPCFQLLHEKELFKFDLFIKDKSAFSDQEFARALEVDLGEGVIGRFLTPEDIVLRKLQWFELGNRVSDRQWNDIMGVLEVSGHMLDRAYMQRWAAELGVADLLEEAWTEVTAS